MPEITVCLSVRVDPSTLGLNPAEHLAMSIRSHATSSGECACGAHAEYEDVDDFSSMVMEHEPDCPAISTAYEAATGKVLKQILHRVLTERYQNKRWYRNQ